MNFSKPYLDDSGTSKLRFLADANLNQMVRKRERQFDLESVRVELNRRIGTIFAKQRLEPVLFPSSWRPQQWCKSPGPQPRRSRG